MPTDKILKFKRGNTTKNNAYTGSDGELTVDRTKKTLVVHDGINAGGSPLATEESVNNVIQELENKVDINENITTQGNLFNGLDQLVKLDSSGKLPAVDGSQLTGVSSGSLVNSGVSAGTYKSVTVNSKGIITAGTNPTTLSEYGITDAATSSSLNIEKGRIDAILSASSADKDSFKEIVDLINSVDSTNDTAFAGYVLSNNAAVSSKAPVDSPTFIGTVVLPSTTSIGNVSATELEYLDGLTSNIQDQLDDKISIVDIQNELDLKANKSEVISKDSVTGVAFMPSGTTAQRPTLLSTDKAIRFNTDLQGWESWNGSSWGSLGGGQMLGSAANKAISYNAQVIAENIVVPAGVNAYSIGDVTIENGYTVTIENGSVYKIL